MNFHEKRVNPRFKKFFPITLTFESFTLKGRAIEPSAFGASVEVNEYEFNRLKDNPAFWENDKPVAVSTDINELSAVVNNLKICDDGKFLISIKLLDNRSWYQ